MSKKRRLIVILSTLALVVLTLVVMLNYRSTTVSRTINDAYQVLTDSATAQILAFKSTLDGEYSVLSVFGGMVAEQLAEFNAEAASQQMDSLYHTANFIEIYAITRDGQVVFDDNHSIDFSDRDFFRNSIMGQNAISKINVGSQGESIFTIAMPIMLEEEIVGVIAGVYNERVFRDILVSSAYQGNAYSYICDGQGDVVIGSDASAFIFNTSSSFGDNTNLLNFLNQVAPEEADEVAANLSINQGGVFQYQSDGRNNYVVYEPMGINDWFIFSNVDSAVVDVPVKEANRAVMIVFIIVMGWAVLALVFFVYFADRETKAMQREQQQLKMLEQGYRIAAQHSNSQVFSYDLKNDILLVYQTSNALGISEDIKNPQNYFVETGIICEESQKAYAEFCQAILSGKNKDSVVFLANINNQGRRWMLAEFTMVYNSKSQPVSAVITVVDVTEQRQKEVAYEKWKQELAAMPKGKTTIIDWNMTKDSVDSDGADVIADDFAAYYEEIQQYSSFDERMRYYGENHVYEADRKKFLEAVKRENYIELFKQGIHESNLEYRQIAYDNVVCWKRFSVQMVQYPQSDEIKAYIVLEDIDQKKQAELALLARSENDPLTGILNRAAFTMRMDAILADEENQGYHAFMIVDIDYFKEINDTYGHIMGDNVLIDVAKRLTDNVRGGDLVGRLGGDEFVIFIRDMRQREAVEKKATDICAALNKSFEHGPNISCSVGIALVPTDGNQFNELYLKADAALYAAKAKGRNTYVFAGSLQAEANDVADK